MQVSPQNWNIRIIYAVTALLLFIVFAMVNRPEEKSGPQKAFETWLSEVAPQLENPRLKSTPLPPIAVKLASRGQSFALALRLDPEHPETMSAKIGRILEMAREANLFSIEPSSDGDLQFSVETGQQKFENSFYASDIQDNGRAQAMMKLLQIYAQSVQVK